MNESTYVCNKREQIAGTVQQVAACLSQQSFETSTGAHQGYEVVVQPITGRRRTPTQNNCIHAYCELVAADLNAAGYDMVISSDVLKEDLHVPWDKDSVKEHMWRPIMENKFHIKSTSEMSTTQCMEVHEIMSHYLAEHKGITTPWPTWMNAGGTVDEYEGRGGG